MASWASALTSVDNVLALVVSALRGWLKTFWVEFFGVHLQIRDQELTYSQHWKR